MKSIKVERGLELGKVIIIPADITLEENEENLKRIIEVLESIAQELYTIDIRKIREEQ